MKNITATLPDGSQRDYESGTTIDKIALSIGKRLAKDAIAATVNGNLVDLDFPLTESADIAILTNSSEEALEIIRHSAAHIMAQAVKKLFPEAKYAIGPAIKDGFYYDFDVDNPFHPEDLEKIEQEMAAIINQGLAFQRSEMPIDDAIQYFKDRQDPYKVEILEDIKKLPDNGTISIYQQGDFIDLCRGPHIPTTKYLKAFKILKSAGAYWRGDSKNAMLQRIYGTAFSNDKLLKAHLNRLEEAKKRDHRKIGKELDLFSFHDEGPGFPFWHPKGSVIFDTLVHFMKNENKKRGYSEVKTPVILHESLWHASGHYENFKENMYFTQIDDRGFAVKPMNCPGHCLIYKNNLHSYKELPIKLAEFGLVHRHELSGVLHGLFRVRNFTQDDAHVYCTLEQLKDEITELIDYCLFVYRSAGFSQFNIFIATRPDKYIGSDDHWDNATKALEGALQDLHIDYKIKEGEGAFYGPKIEFNIKDCLERDWQCGTIQVDFSMPGRLGCTYEGADGQKHTPVMLHRAILGSLERFIGIVIEHYAGKLPLWLAPIQVKLLPIIEKHFDYAKKIEKKLQQHQIRVEVDLHDDKLGYKIRKSQLEKIPYMIILGDNEVDNETLSVRSRDQGDLGHSDINAFIDLLNKEIDSKGLEAKESKTDQD